MGRVLISACAAGLAGLLSVMPAPAQECTNKAGVFSMIHESPDAEIPIQAELARAFAGACGYVKVFSYDLNLQSAEKIGAFVGEAGRHSLKSVLRLGGWDRPDPSRYSSIAADYVAFVDAVNSVARTRLQYVIIRNEPNLAHEWGGSPNPEEYGIFLQTIARALKEYDPQIRVLNAALAVTDGTASGDISTELYIGRMFRAVPELAFILDVWNSHAYPQRENCGLQEQGKFCFFSYNVELDALRPFYRRVGRDDPKVAITETSWRSEKVVYSAAEFSGVLSAYRKDPAVIMVILFALTGYPDGQWNNYALVERTHSGKYFPTENFSALQSR